MPKTKVKKKAPKKPKGPKQGIGHTWHQLNEQTGCGADYLWECCDCGANYYINDDQGYVTSEFNGEWKCPGDGTEE